MAMTFERLQLRPAICEDAARIAEIHMAAFKHNAMLHAQFPTPTIRKSLQICIEEKALADINDPRISVLVVTTSDGKDELPSTSRFLWFQTFVSWWMSTDSILPTFENCCMKVLRPKISYNERIIDSFVPHRVSKEQRNCRCICKMVTPYLSGRGLCRVTLDMARRNRSRHR